MQEENWLSPQKLGELLNLDELGVQKLLNYKGWTEFHWTNIGLFETLSEEGKKYGKEDEATPVNPITGLHSFIWKESAVPKLEFLKRNRNFKALVKNFMERIDKIYLEESVKTLKKIEKHRRDNIPVFKAGGQEKITINDLCDFLDLTEFQLARWFLTQNLIRNKNLKPGKFYSRKPPAFRGTLKLFTLLVDEKGNKVATEDDTLPWGIKFYPSAFQYFLNTPSYSELQKDLLREQEEQVRQMIYTRTHPKLTKRERKVQKVQKINSEATRREVLEAKVAELEREGRMVMK